MKREKMDYQLLYNYAELVATTIVIRDENHSDERRDTTNEERDYIFAVVKSALYSLNYNCDADVQAVADMAEFTIDELIPNCNGYLTVYNPIKRFVEQMWDTTKD